MQRKIVKLTLFRTAKFFTMSIVFAHYYQPTLKFDFITTDIQFNVKEFGDKHGCCKEVCL